MAVGMAVEIRIMDLLLLLPIYNRTQNANLPSDTASHKLRVCHHDCGEVLDTAPHRTATELVASARLPGRLPLTRQAPFPAATDAILASNGTPSEHGILALTSFDWDSIPKIKHPGGIPLETRAPNPQSKSRGIFGGLSSLSLLEGRALPGRTPRPSTLQTVARIPSTLRAGF